MNLSADDATPAPSATIFDTATAVSETSPGHYAAELGEGWVVGGGINGGYLLATIARAAGQAVPSKPDPISISAYYLSASRPGPATVDVRVLREGGSVASVAADLSQAEGHRIAALATYGDLSRDADHVETTAEEPELPPREQCVPNTLAPPEFLAASPFLRRFDMLFHPDQVGWAVGEPDHSGVLSAWFRLEDGHEPDPLSLLLVLDALPPVMFTHGRMGWAPTLELTAHVRARPAPGWLKVRHATRNIAGGMFEEDCEIWDSTGRLVAQSRQLARVPRG